MKVRLWPYKLGSNGCKNLKTKLIESGIDCLRIKPDGNYRPRNNHLIINWGNSTNPNFLEDIRNGNLFLNKPYAVASASNKLKTFLEIEAYNNIGPEVPINIPLFTTMKPEAQEWLFNGATDRVYCRTKLSGHSGDGIVVARTPEELVNAPLYVAGIKVNGEYRLHVFGNKVIDVIKKRKRNTALEENTLNEDIRNLLGGWVYCHNNIDISDTVKQSAVDSVKALGLDFGAVDVLIEKRTHKHYILEINSAPGLESDITLNAYVLAIKDHIASI